MRTALSLDQADLLLLAFWEGKMILGRAAVIWPRWPTHAQHLDLDSIGRATVLDQFT